MPKNTKASDFKRVAGPRVERALNKIDVLLPLANTATYAYSEEQVEQILQALREKADAVEAAFSAGLARQTRGNNQFAL